MLKPAFQAAALSALVAVGSCSDGPTPPPVDETYDIEVRFFGPAMSAQNQALFTNASNRIMEIVTGDLVAAAAVPVNLNSCPNVDESVPINEEVDDIIIYASIQSNDGPGGVLASAGPCFVRAVAGKDMTAIGVMNFDSADLGTLAAGGDLQDVITHEMLHVLGVGTLWSEHGLIQDAGGASPRYTGTHGRAGCVGAGGTTVCAEHVPVEGNAQPVGTRDAHWRESTFNQEMMTGFLDQNAPISAMTIGALRDLGFTVDATQADPYTVPAGGVLPLTVGKTVSGAAWEQLIRPVASLDGGRVVSLRRP